MEATIYVYTFREGLLGKFGHDLRLSLQRFEIKARGSDIVGEFSPRSLEVDGAMVNGRLDVNALSPSDKQKIHDTICQEVLRTREHAEVRLSARTTSSIAPYHITGQLTLCGVTRPVQLVLEERGDKLLGSLELTPSQWGVKPYRALGGALKVQDRVRVSIDASADWLKASGELNPAVELTWRPRERTSRYPTRDRASQTERPRPSRP